MLKKKKERKRKWKTSKRHPFQSKEIVMAKIRTFEQRYASIILDYKTNICGPILLYLMLEYIKCNVLWRRLINSYVHIPSQGFQPSSLLLKFRLCPVNSFQKVSNERGEKDTSHWRNLRVKAQSGGQGQHNSDESIW
jgi:hypothetical protein